MTTTNIDKIVIKGAPAKYDASELARRQQQYQVAYKQTSQSCDMVRGGHPKQFLQAVIDHAAMGYTLTDYAVSLDPAAYSTLMRRSEAMQEADLNRINNEVRDAYRAELEADRAKYQSLLLEQLLQAEEQKQVKAAASAKEKLLARLQKEVADCYAPLVFPEA